MSGIIKQNIKEINTIRIGGPVYQFLRENKECKTPKSQIKKRPDGLEYVTEEYMRQFLQRYFPGKWSWRGSDSPFVITHDHVIVSGHLIVEWPDGKVQYFFSPGAARIQYKRGEDRTPENIIDLDSVVAAANSNALKRAINRLLDVASDVYRKSETLEATQEQVEEVKHMIQSINDEQLRNYYTGLVKRYLEENNGIFYKNDMERLVKRLNEILNKQ